MTWFKRLADGVTTHPWLVIGAWIAAGVIVVVLSPQIVTFTSNNNSSFLPSSYESVQASQVAAKYFPAQAQASGIIVVSAPDGRVLSSTDQQKVAGLAQTLMADNIPSVETVTTSPLYLSSNQRVQLVQVVFKGQAGDAGPNSAVVTVRDKTNQYLTGSGLVGQLTGSAAISVDSTKAFDSAEKVITIATVVLILLLLGIVFRSLLIALLPIIVIGAVHQMAQAVTADLADWFHFEVGPELAPLLVVVMFGVGTDYIVFLLFRYREHLANGEPPGQALRTSLAKVGEVITSAAATVIAAFAALLVASLESLRTLAPGLIVGILLMLLAAMTLVPAILSLLGHEAVLADPPPPSDLAPSHPVGAHRRHGRPAPGPRPVGVERSSSSPSPWVHSASRPPTTSWPSSRRRRRRRWPSTPWPRPSRPALSARPRSTSSPTPRRRSTTPTSRRSPPPCPRPPGWPP